MLAARRGTERRYDARDTTAENMKLDTSLINASTIEFADLDGFLRVASASTDDEINLTHRVSLLSEDKESNLSQN
jgi:hypothetical protein